MRIDTQRFGTLDLDAKELFLFPQGLIGMESLRHWAILPDNENDSTVCEQSVWPKASTKRSVTPIQNPFWASAKLSETITLADSIPKIRPLVSPLLSTFD